MPRKKKTPPGPWDVRETLLANPNWLEYVRAAQAIDPGEDYPYFSYVGVNFTQDRIKNFKFYFSFYRTLTPAEIDLLLPVENRGRFAEFYAQWHPTKSVKALHRGVTFALKVDADGKLTHYYHLRVKGVPFGPPERLNIRGWENNGYHGVCEEFSGGKAHLKRYFYCEDLTTIAESLELCGLTPRTHGVIWLEYIESEGRDKMTWVTNDSKLVMELLDRRAQPEIIPVLTDICLSCGFNLFAPGSSRDGSDHALYFFPVKAMARFDGAAAFCTKYLGLRGFRERAPIATRAVW